MAKIDEVARAAGVSISTVSYALSGKRPVSADTRRRIQDAVLELGYSPNAGARMLAGSQTNIFALSEPLRADSHAPSHMAFMHGGLAIHLDTDLAGRLAALLRAPGVDMLQIRSAGGAINDTSPDATAYAHRHQNFSVTAVAGSAGAAFDAAWAPVREVLDGLYLSFESTHRPDDLHRAFPPATLERLRRIKGEWDSDDVFSQNFDVGVPTA